MHLTYEPKFHMWRPACKNPNHWQISVFFSTLHATRAGMTPWRRAWVRWKADIQEMDFKKIYWNFLFFHGEISFWKFPKHDPEGDKNQSFIKFCKVLQSFTKIQNSMKACEVLQSFMKVLWSFTKALWNFYVGFIKIWDVLWNGFIKVKFHVLVLFFGDRLSS